MSKSVYVIAAAAVCLAGQAQAGDTVLYGAAPDWVEEVPRPSAEGAKSPLVLFDIQQRIEGGMLTAHVDQAFVLNSPQALTQGGTTGAQWMPDKGDLTINRVAILRGEEEIDVLESGARYTVLRRESNLERRMLDGILTATMPVPGLRMGDILRVSYTVTSRDPALDGNVQATVPLLAEPVAASFARVQMSWPKGQDVRWLAGPRVEGIEEADEGGYHIVMVPLPLAKPDPMPEDAPSRFVRPPILQAGTFAGWQEVSRLFAPLYDPAGTIAPGSALEREVDAIASASNDPLVRAARATQLVQDKIGYLLNGMNGGNYVPQSPAETWDTRYGDCKAKALLLLAMLDRLGIQAEAVLVNTALSDATSDLLPIPGAFDHVFVRAEIDGMSYWLDGTSAGTRVQNIADTPPFRTVLPVRAEGAGLLALAPRVPAAPDTIVDMTVDQRAGVEVPAIVSARIQITGPIADQMSAQYKNLTPEQADDTLSSFAQSVTDEIYLAEGDMIFDAENATATVTYKGVVTSGWQNDGGRVRRTLDEFESAGLEFGPNRARAAWKDIPVEMGAPTNMRTTVRYLLPDTIDAFELTGLDDLDTTYAGRHLVRTVSRSGSELTVIEHVTSEGGELPASEIAAEKRKIAAISGSPPAIVTEAHPMRRWQYADKDKRKLLDPIEAAYSAAIARDEEDATAWLNRARFLHGTFDYRGAIADFTKAIELEPETEYYQARASAYASLNNTEAQIADYRHVFELSPSLETAAALALALGEAGQTDEAMELIDQFDTGGSDRDTVAQTRAEILAWAGRQDEGLSELQAMIARQPGRGDLVNSECWYRARFRVGLDDLMDVCNAAVERANFAAGALDSRALAWLQVGQPEKAKADAQAALALQPGLFVTRYVLAHAERALGDKGADAFIDFFGKAWPHLAKQYASYGLKH
ncbi:DUF3857 domain-containing protein [Qipengyuania sp.]|uniref:DUF3857 domain-containing protein n=1 Tax=Qipengyuania sp. TaxID=2004515 RepID=UPI0035C80E10